MCIRAFAGLSWAEGLWGPRVCPHGCPHGARKIYILKYDENFGGTHGARLGARMGGLGCAGDFWEDGMGGDQGFFKVCC